MNEENLGLLLHVIGREDDLSFLDQSKSMEHKINVILDSVGVHYRSISSPKSFLLLVSGMVAK